MEYILKGASIGLLMKSVKHSLFCYCEDPILVSTLHQSAQDDYSTFLTKQFSQGMSIVIHKNYLASKSKLEMVLLAQRSADAT